MFAWARHRAAAWVCAGLRPPGALRWMLLRVSKSGEKKKKPFLITHSCSTADIIAEPPLCCNKTISWASFISHKCSQNAKSRTKEQGADSLWVEDTELKRLSGTDHTCAGWSSDPASAGPVIHPLSGWVYLGSWAREGWRVRVRVKVRVSCGREPAERKGKALESPDVTLDFACEMWKRNVNYNT